MCSVAGRGGSKPQMALTGYGRDPPAKVPGGVIVTWGCVDCYMEHDAGFSSPDLGGRGSYVF